MEAELHKLQELEAAERELQEKCAKEFGIQTDSLVGIGAGTGITMEVDAQIQSFADLYGAQLQQLRANVETQKKQLGQMESLHVQLQKQAEQEVTQRHKSIEELFMATSEKLDQERKKIQTKEQEYRAEDKGRLDSVVRQKELMEQLEHKQKQLLMYIEEKEHEGLPDSERVEPLGESCSEESLNSAKGYARPTKASKSKKTSATHNRPVDSISTQAQVHSSYASPLSTPQSRERSPRPQGTRNLRTSQADSSLIHEKRSSPKLRTSSIAEKVTARLYQPDQSRRGQSPDHSPQSWTSSKNSKSHSAPGPLRVPALSPHRHDPTKKTQAKDSSHGKRPAQSDPRLPQLMVSNPRLRQSTSSLASVPESIDESLEDSRNSSHHDTAGKDTAFDDISMGTIDSLQDELVLEDYVVPPRVRRPSHERSRSHSPGRPPRGKDPPLSPEQQFMSSTPAKSRSSNHIASSFSTDHPTAPMKQTSGETVTSESGEKFDKLQKVAKDKSSPRKTWRKSEGTESGVEVNEGYNGDEVSPSTPPGVVPSRTSPEGIVQVPILEFNSSSLGVVNPAYTADHKSIPHEHHTRQHLEAFVDSKSKAGSLPEDLTNDAIQHVEAMTFQTSTDVHRPTDVPMKSKDLQEGSKTKRSKRPKSSSPAPKIPKTKKEDGSKRKSRSPQVRQSVSGAGEGALTPSTFEKSADKTVGAVEQRGSSDAMQKSISPSPQSGRRGSDQKGHPSPSPSVTRKTSLEKSVSPSSRSVSKESIGSESRMSVDSTGSQDRTGPTATSSTNKKTKRKAKDKRSGGKEDQEEGAEKTKRQSSSKKRDKGKDATAAEYLLSRPKKRQKDNIPMEGSLSSAAGPLPRVTDPTHEFFAKSLRSGIDHERSRSLSSGKISAEEVSLAEDGTKIIRRLGRCASADSLSSSEGRGKGSEDSMRRHPDGQTQSSEDGESESAKVAKEDQNQMNFGIRYKGSEVDYGMEVDSTRGKEQRYSGDSLDEDSEVTDRVGEHAKILNSRREAEEHVFSEDSLDLDLDDRTTHVLSHSLHTEVQHGDKYKSESARVRMNESAPSVLPLGLMTPETTEVSPRSVQQQGPVIKVDKMTQGIQRATKSGPKIPATAEGVAYVEELRRTRRSQTAELSIPPNRQDQFSADSLTELPEDEETIHQVAPPAMADAEGEQGEKLR